MNKTEIVWTDVTWNPVSGCTPVSAECKHCYARTLAENKRGTTAFPHGFDLKLKPHKLREPSRLRTPSLVFVNSMGDLFHDDVPDAYRDEVLDVMRACPRHTFQALTKRPLNAECYFAARTVPANLWLGVSCGGEEWTHRIDTLRRINAAVRFVSAEPLIKPLGDLDLRGVSWLIVGGESGPHLCDSEVCAARGLVTRAAGGKWIPRPDRLGWVRDARDAALAAGVPFLFKQWGGSRGPIAGRELDGRIWDEYPTPDRLHPYAPRNTIAV